MGYISDRMACGLAIILRSSFFLFQSQDEWKCIGDLFDMLAIYTAARGLVFDGIASTVEFAVPSEAEGGSLKVYSKLLKEKPTLSVVACTTLQRVLFKYIYGAYSGDVSLANPAMACVEKTYKHTVKINQIQHVTKNGGATPPRLVPDEELWYRVAIAFYSVCKSDDPDASKVGWEYFQRHVMSTETEDVEDEKWVTILQLMVSKQPSLDADVSRVHAFSILGQIIVKVLPSLTQRKSNWKVLTEFTKDVAALAETNLRYGRKGGVKPLFQYTLQTVTFLSNHMASPSFGGEKRYSTWASETFLGVLEKVGAAGGSTKNVALTKKGDSSTDETETTATEADSISAP